MNKIFNLIMLMMACLLITACDDDNEPETITPIHFEKRDYTIMFGKGAVIPFTGGGGVYELSASNPEVLGKFGIDMEMPFRLYIQPSKVGESDLTIKDVNAESSVTLHFTVENFYLSFKIDEIEGKNTNEFFEVGRELRFIRDEDNTKPVKVIWYQYMTFRPITCAEGIFDITRNEANIFTMDFALHQSHSEEVATYAYTMGGDGRYMTLFNSIFNFGWKKDVEKSRSQPVERIQMTLTDKSNDCKIICHLVQ